jgi:hypothetical protein
MYEDLFFENISIILKPKIFIKFKENICKSGKFLECLCLFYTEFLVGLKLYGERKDITFENVSFLFDIVSPVTMFSKIDDKIIIEKDTLEEYSYSNRIKTLGYNKANAKHAFFGSEYFEEYPLNFHYLCLMEYFKLIKDFEIGIVESSFVLNPFKDNFTIKKYENGSRYGYLNYKGEYKNFLKYFFVNFEL